MAEHEYVIDDVNKWWFLARSGRRAGATSLAMHGDLARSARHRSHASFGIGDELRCSFVLDGTYWGATGFLRDEGTPWFTDDDVRFLASLSEPIEGASGEPSSPSWPQKTSWPASTDRVWSSSTQAATPSWWA